MRNLEDAIYFAINKTDKRENIRCIDIPNYYNFEEMCTTFHNILQSNQPVELKRSSITIICTSYDGFRKAIELGFNARYLYDHLDFTDTHYYVLNEFPLNYHNILESADGITGDVIDKIFVSLPEGAKLYVFHDSFIPRRYNGIDDINFLNHYNTYNMEMLYNNKSWHSNGINSILNKLRSKKYTIENIIDKANVFGGKVEMVLTDEFKLSDIDISKPVITPHITIVPRLNIELRRYLGIINYEDECMPMPNEWLITHGPSICHVDGQEISLPIGYRFKVKSLIPSNMANESFYRIKFDYEYPTGVVKEALILASKTYLEELILGGSDLIPPHPQSFKVFFGYVVGSFYFLENRVDEATIIYDYTLSNERRDLYASLIPIRNNAKIFYNLTKKIKFKE